MDLASSDSQESQAATAGTDVASTVLGFAPYWVFSYSWHCQHPSDNSSEPSFIQFSEPQTTEEVLQLYRNRQMKGSNLVVGLSSGNIASGQTIPSTFFRTLAYVFEVAKSGQTYAPLTEDDLLRGAPVKGWCEPLWLRSSEGGLSSDNDEQEPCQDPAQQLLSSAPYWCYLYNHEPSRAKKTPPKEADQILAMYRSGSLPDWTPVLGLQHDVSTFNSLPPSLFMPLGTLLHLAASGIPCRAVGLAELTRWDKFIGSRTSNGCTQGALQPGVPTRSSRGHSQSFGTFTSTSTAMQNLVPGGGDLIPGQGNHSQLAPFHYPNQQPYNSYCAPHNYMPYQMLPNGQMYPSPYGAPSNGPSAATAGMPPMMWGCGQYPTNQTGFVPSHSVPNSSFGASRQFSMENPATLATGKGPLHVDRSGWNTNNSHLQRNSRRSSSGKKGNSGGLGQGQQNSNSFLAPFAATPAALAHAAPMPHGPEAGGNARHWDTALFRLFTADATRGAAHASWWKMAPEGGSPTGPLGCEQMVIDFARGILADNHLVCGTTADAPAHIAPAHDLFESVGSLLVQVDQGGHYVLVSPLEVIESAKAAGAVAHADAAALGPLAHLEPSANGMKPGIWSSSSNSRDTDRQAAGDRALSMLMEEGVDASAKVKANLAFLSGNKGHKKGGRGDSNRDQKPRGGGDPRAPRMPSDARHPQDARSKYENKMRLAC